MDKIEYCKSIQSQQHLEVVTTYFEETMSLYNVGKIANQVVANVNDFEIVYILTFESEDEAEKASWALLANPISNYNKNLKVSSVTRGYDKTVTVTFKH